MSIDGLWNAMVDKVTGWVEGLFAMLPNLAVAIVVLVAFWAASRLVARALHGALGKLSRNAQVNSLLASMAKAAVLIAGFFVALGLLDLDKTVTSLLAGIGVVGIALGFAFQDIAANFMSGIIMAVRHPFREGDYVKSSDVEGVVERMDLRATLIRRTTGERVTIPNKEVLQNVLTNFSDRGTRRVDIPVGVSYAEDLERAASIALEAVSGVPGRVSEREVELYYTGFGDSSIDFVLRFWIPYKRQVDYMRARSAAIVRIKKAYDAAGVTIPFPIRTLDFSTVGGKRLDEALPDLGSGREETPGPESHH